MDRILSPGRKQGVEGVERGRTLPHLLCRLQLPGRDPEEIAERCQDQLNDGYGVPHLGLGKDYELRHYSDVTVYHSLFLHKTAGHPRWIPKGFQEARALCFSLLGV